MTTTTGYGTTTGMATTTAGATTTAMGTTTGAGTTPGGTTGGAFATTTGMPTTSMPLMLVQSRGSSAAFLGVRSQSESEADFVSFAKCSCPCGGHPVRRHEVLETPSWMAVEEANTAGSTWG